MTQRRNPESSDIEPGLDTDQQIFEEFVQECAEAYQKILQTISAKIHNHNLVQKFLRSPSNLGYEKTNYEMIGYYRIINQMVNSIQELKMTTLIIDRFYQGKYETETSAELPNLKDSVLSATINWLGIYYAMDATVVGQKIADSIRQNHHIQNIWNQLSETLNQLLNNPNLKQELQTNGVKIQANAGGGFDISVTLLEAQGGESIFYHIYPPQTPLPE